MYASRGSIGIDIWRKNKKIEPNERRPFNKTQKNWRMETNKRRQITGKMCSNEHSYVCV